jgi:hypothetical protein
METPDPVSKLLRLKRYEQPSAGYHEAFLREFQRRQRASLLRRHPLAEFWDGFVRIGPSFEVPRLAYAGIAAAAVVAAGVMLMPPRPAPQTTASASLVGLPDFSLAQRPVTIGETLPASSSRRSAASYVLQPSPASNDQPLSF